MTRVTPPLSSASIRQGRVSGQIGEAKGVDEAPGGRNSWTPMMKTFAVLARYIMREPGEVRARCRTSASVSLSFVISAQTSSTGALISTTNLAFFHESFYSGALQASLHSSRTFDQPCRPGRGPVTFWYFHPALVVLDGHGIQMG